jgi:hypothetical protein
MRKRCNFVSAVLVVLGGVASQHANAAPITYDEYNVTSNTSVNVQLGSLGSDLIINVDGFGINVQAGTGVQEGDTAGVITDGTRTVLPQGTSLPIVEALTAGTVVGPSDSFDNLTGLQNALIDNTDRNGEFPASPEATRYFGFEIVPAGGTPDYGYVTIETINDGTTDNDPNGSTPYAAYVASVTYDPTGAPLTITATPVPEPASAGLAGIASIGLLKRRKRS